MFIDFLKRVWQQNGHQTAIVWHDQSFSYEWLSRRVSWWKSVLASNQLTQGTVVLLCGDFTPNSIALFLALVESSCIVVPITQSNEVERSDFIAIAQAEFAIDISDRPDDAKIKKLHHSADHPLYQELRRKARPGLVLFSSGTMGEKKAAVHDLTRLLRKFETPRNPYRTIPFLLYDHIGGINTMFYTLSNGGCLVTVQDRSPETVLATIEKHQVELLPTSPTFLNLILLSESYKHHSLESLKLITYGTEPMPASILKRFCELLPKIRFLQTYGLSELGILHSKSKASNSLWLKVGGQGFQTRVVDGILQIKAESAMLGYLNASSPFTGDGWFSTGDAVEGDGEYIRFLGRSSEIINVGGEKLYPAEVESVIHEMDGVAEVTVFGEKNCIIGELVCARVTLSKKENRAHLSSRLKHHCRLKLPNYKVPVKILIQEDKQHNTRFKTVRHSVV